MDAQTIRRAVWDLFKFNQKDFNVQGNLTGYGVSLRRQPSTSAAVSCQFAPSLVTVDDTQYVRMAWGIIAGMQPTGFSAGGVPAYDVEAEADTFYYAAATVDPDTLLWNSTFILVSSDPALINSTTTAYRLLFSVGGDPLTLSPYNCGPIYFDVCELANT